MRMLPKVIIIQQVFNSRKWMELVYPAMVAQTYGNIEIIAQIVIDDGLPGEASAKLGGCEEYIRKAFPQIRILKPGYNIGFARGHNEIFASTICEYYQLVNPDLVMETDYVEKMVAAMETDKQIGAATGKLLRCTIGENGTLIKTAIFDTTGVRVSRNGRARDRGQHELDSGQYDQALDIIGVSGAGPMYRKQALEAVKMPRRPDAEAAQDGHYEYFDEDFHSYWEDVDLSLRLLSAGFVCRFVPSAVAFHGRTSGSSRKGYKDVAGFIKHHQVLNRRIKQLNYKNHLFFIIKNFPRFYPKFFFRELAMLVYVFLFEISTLQVLPEMWRQWPLMWKKRKWILAHRKTSRWTELLVNRGLLE